MDDYISFEQFMKTYKPILVAEINRALAQQWLEQANSILQRIAKSVERQRNE